VTLLVIGKENNWGSIPARYIRGIKTEINVGVTSACGKSFLEHVNMEMVQNGAAHDIHAYLN